jgi:hypothetical protein
MAAAAADDTKDYMDMTQRLKQAEQERERLQGEVEGHCLVCEALEQAVIELDDIIDQKGHTARTRDVLAQARDALRATKENHDGKQS